MRVKGAVFRQITQSAVKFPKAPHPASPLACFKAASLLEFHSTPRGSSRWPGLKAQPKTSPTHSLFPRESVPEAAPSHFMPCYLPPNLMNVCFTFSLAVHFQIAEFCLCRYSVIFSSCTYSKHKPGMQRSSSSKPIGRAIHLWCPFAAQCSFSLPCHINLWRVSGEFRCFLSSDISQSIQSRDGTSLISIYFL